MLRVLLAIAFMSMPVLGIYFLAAKGADAEREAAQQIAEAEQAAAAEKFRAETAAVVERLRQMDEQELREYVNGCDAEFYKHLNSDRMIVNYDLLGSSPSAQIDEQIEAVKAKLPYSLTGTVSVALSAFEVRDGFSSSQVIGDYRCEVYPTGEVRIVREGELDISDF